ncbi:hypothetical protein [Phenylobacterium aquaticum]|uniref:hypothetical protein n=1 Tax=Phenylobacterium aquaticum TaxID=1763816 RepID=UPI001F5DB796|nr:hypothetical protein [Phenylobacterium aquaticum]MCI3135155.1 hypothetical protein [Phenylobacterium aquaticum]
MAARGARRSRGRMMGLALLASAAFAAPGLAQAAPATGLTGMWLLKPNDFARQDKPPFTPEAAAAAEQARKATEEQGKVLSEHALKCLPIGMPRFMTNEFALEILETPAGSP